MKVVFHVDELSKWAVATANIKNLLDLKPDTKIVLLINGIGIQGLELKANQYFISQYPGVSFHACQNAMKKHHMEKEDLPAGVKVVSAGVADLIELQEKGYAYIKP